MPVSILLSVSTVKSPLGAGSRADTEGVAGWNCCRASPLGISLGLGPGIFSPEGAGIAAGAPQELHSLVQHSSWWWRILPQIRFHRLSLQQFSAHSQVGAQELQLLAAQLLEAQLLQLVVAGAQL